MSKAYICVLISDDPRKIRMRDIPLGLNKHLKADFPDSGAKCTIKFENGSTSLWAHGNPEDLPYILKYVFGFMRGKGVPYRT